MPNLWLTYAWKDNESEDVDFVAQRVEEQGIAVKLDRTQLLAGRRLWEQLDRHIADSSLDGWALYVTENSLRSEPCQEELAYALDRALRVKGRDFPLIGIFPTPIDREFIPSAIATRIYVTLKDEKWASRIADALSGTSSQRRKAIDPYEVKVHPTENGVVYEMRPREGVWHPAQVMVLEDERDACSRPFPWARGQFQYRPAMFIGADVKSVVAADGSRWSGWRIDQQVDSTQSIFLPTTRRLSRISFGRPGLMPVVDLF